MKIILIHGRSQQNKREAKLRQLWIDALFQGFADQGLEPPDHVTFEFPYYGDLLIAEIAKHKEPKSGDTVSRGALEEEDPAFLVQLYRDLLENSKIDPDAVLAQDREELAGRGAENSWIVRKLAAALDRSSWISDLTLKIATDDVYHYLAVPSVREAIDRKIAKCFSDEPVVVIGHSLGSVVAYNALVSESCPANIQAFITVGSPLGLNGVRQKLKAPVQNPSSIIIRQWYNAYDPKDFVALRPLQGRNFNVLPEIINDGSVNNSSENHHGIEAYLNHPEVVMRVFNAITQAS